jgi:hypothetical protein
MNGNYFIIDDNGCFSLNIENFVFQIKDKDLKFIINKLSLLENHLNNWKTYFNEDFQILLENATLLGLDNFSKEEIEILHKKYLIQIEYNHAEINKNINELKVEINKYKEYRDQINNKIIITKDEYITIDVKSLLNIFDKLEDDYSKNIILIELINIIKKLKNNLENGFIKNSELSTLEDNSHKIIMNNDNIDHVFLNINNLILLTDKNKNGYSDITYLKKFDKELYEKGIMNFKECLLFIESLKDDLSIIDDIKNFMEISSRITSVDDLSNKINILESDKDKLKYIDSFLKIRNKKPINAFLIRSKPTLDSIRIVSFLNLRREEINKTFFFTKDGIFNHINTISDTHSKIDYLNKIKRELSEHHKNYPKFEYEKEFNKDYYLNFGSICSSIFGETYTYENMLNRINLELEILYKKENFSSAENKNHSIDQSNNKNNKIKKIKWTETDNLLESFFNKLFNSKLIDYETIKNKEKLIKQHFALNKFDKEDFTPDNCNKIILYGETQMNVVSLFDRICNELLNKIFSHIEVANHFSFILEKKKDGGDIEIEKIDKPKNKTIASCRDRLKKL